MTVQLIKKDRYHIHFNCNEDAISNALSIDIQKVFYEYLNEFSVEINSEIWDYFAVEFWFDSGQLIFFPEKKINEVSTEYDPFPSERLDPYFVVVLTSYLKKYDEYIEHDYDSIKEKTFEEWHLMNCREVFDSVSCVLSEIRFSSFILKSLNKKTIIFHYFGTSREIIYGGKTIVSNEL